MIVNMSHLVSRAERKNRAKPKIVEKHSCAQCNDMKEIKCNICNGYSYISDLCMSCSGTGRIKVKLISVGDICGDCGGYGRVKVQCRGCNGGTRSCPLCSL